MWKNRIACIEKIECLWLATEVIIVLLCAATLSKNCLLMPHQKITTEEKQRDKPDVQHDDETGSVQTETPKEIDGREGLEPTRYGDWEKNGRCIDF